MLVPLLAVLGACGSGSGQLRVGLSGDFRGSAYNQADQRTYPQYKPGDEATFTVHVVNAGPGSVSGVTVHVTLPGNFRYHATTNITSPGSTRTQPLDAEVNSSAPIFGLWTLAQPGTAGPGVDSSVDLTFTVDVAGQPGGAVVQAFAVGDTNAGQTTTATYNVVVNPAANLTALVTVTPGTVKRGGTVTYSVRIINGGTGNASGVGILVTLPPVMTFAASVTPFAGNGTRSMGVDPIKDTLEVFYDGFTLPPLSNAGPGFVVVVFKALVLGGRSLATPGASPGVSPPPSSAPSTVPPGTYTVDASLTDADGDRFTVHAVAPVTVT